MLASPNQALISVDAVLTRPSGFCCEPVTAERGPEERVPEQVPSASSLSPLLLAALAGLAAVLHPSHLALRPLLHMEMS